MRETGRSAIGPLKIDEFLSFLRECARIYVSPASSRAPILVSYVKAQAGLRRICRDHPHFRFRADVELADDGRPIAYLPHGLGEPGDQR